MKNQVGTFERQFKTFKEYRYEGYKTKQNLVVDYVNNKEKEDRKNKEKRRWKKKVRAESIMLSQIKYI